MARNSAPSTQSWATAAEPLLKPLAELTSRLKAYPTPGHLEIASGSAEADELLEQMARSNPHRGAYLLAAKTLEAFEDRQGAARWRQRAARQDDSAR